MTAFFVSLIFLISLSRFLVLAKLTSTERKFIVDHHNLKRETSTPAPDPAKLVLIQWDDGLASLAQAWSDKCEWKQSRAYGWVPEKEKTIGPDGEAFGDTDLHQNVAMEYESEGSPSLRLKSAIDFWDGQKYNYDYCSGKEIDKFRVADPYLGLIWAETTHVGCGKTCCGKAGDKFELTTCYYWPKGNLHGCRPFKAQDDKYCGDESGKVDTDSLSPCGSGGRVGKKTRKEVEENEKAEKEKEEKEKAEKEKEEKEKEEKAKEENAKEEKGKEEKEGEGRDEEGNRQDDEGIKSGEDRRIGRAAWEVTTSAILTSVALGLGNILGE